MHCFKKRICHNGQMRLVPNLHFVMSVIYHLSIVIVTVKRLCMVLLIV